MIKRVQIYQIDLEKDTKRVAFESFERAKKVDTNIYNKVFDNEIEFENLEDIFRIFNIEVGMLRARYGYVGRSLSVSDIVVYDNDHYYCDSVGFKLLSLSDIVLFPEANTDIETNPVEEKKRYKVYVNFEGAIGYTVRANDIDEAESIAQALFDEESGSDICNNIGDITFDTEQIK